ncbi:hypothetical protein TUM4433_40400 [Shewanella schlegeliana]|nr:hypothetical protein [Shewanella schlegeliana]GIU38574.1 hypothetical protein TUM4433_40400 [Shewanella schlegeliana]
MNERSKIAQGFYVFVAGLSSGYALMPIYPSYILLTVAIATLFICTNLRVVRTNFLISVFLFVVFFIGCITSIQSIGNLTAVIKLQIVVLFSFVVVSTVKYERFVSLYITFMLIVSIVSLVLYTLVNFFDFNIHSYLPIIYNENDMGYYNGFVFFIFSSEYIQYRNTGFFWEPGIFSSYLTLAILLTKHVS